MRIDYRQSRYLGIALIAIGVFAVLRLWWILPTAILTAAGMYLYMQRRQVGRTNEAVQGGLWLVGLGVLFLINFLFPGVLLLAGASLLLRGREHEVDMRVQHVLARFKNNRNGASVPSTHNVPVHAAQPDPQPQAQQEDTATTGKTIRL